MAYALFDGHSLKSITLQDTAAWQQFFGLGGSGPLSDVLTLYREVPWLYRGVTLRASAVAAMPYTFSAGRDELVPEDVIGTPRLPLDIDLPGLLRQFELWLTLFGRAYAHKEINRMGRATTLRPLLPTTVTPQFAPDGLAYFERQVNGQQTKVTTEELFHVWYPAAGAEQGPGESPASIAQGAASALLNKESVIRAFYSRGGIKPTLISIPERTNDNDRDRLQGWLDRTISGLSNAFKAKLWRGELKATEIGPDPEKLALRETTDMSREDTGAALGVPPSMLAANAANFATSQQDVRTFHDWTVIPEATLICAALNEQVFAPFGLSLQPRPDLMEMYQDDKSAEADKLIALVETGGLTLNELRGMLDLGELTPQQIADNLALVRMLFAAKNPAQMGGGQLVGETPVIFDSTATVSKASSLEDDLNKWQAKAVRRWAEGKPEKALDFVSEAIPGALAAAIRGGLEAAQSEADVKAVFTWSSYP